MMYTSIDIEFYVYGSAYTQQMYHWHTICLPTAYIGNMWEYRNHGIASRLMYYFLYRVLAMYILYT